MNPEGLRPASDYLDSMIREQQRPRLVTIDEGHFDVHHPEQYGNLYSIPISSCTERDDILRWIRQLSEKPWVTPLVIEDFAKAMIWHFGVRG